MQTNYHKRETFEGENFHELVKKRRKLSQIVRLCCAEGCHTPKFHGKTFANNHKTAKFAKVFSIESFPLYGM